MKLLTVGIFCLSMVFATAWITGRVLEDGIETKPNNTMLIKLVNIADDIRNNAPATSETLHGYADAIYDFAAGNTGSVIIPDGTKTAYNDWARNKMHR